MRPYPENRPMTNREIADIMVHIARILEIQGENPFKIRAYRKAADTIGGLDFELSTVKDRDRIQDLPGIGEAIASKIAELIETGRLGFYESLLESDEAELVAFLEIPGMGPKHTRLVFEQLGIKTLDALKAAAEEGRLRELPGMGAKAEQNILQGILQVRKYKERRPLAAVYPIALEIAERLASVESARNVLIAGSLRRMRDTIADVDILAASADPESVMDAFVGLRQVEKVLAKGRTKSSVRVRDDVQVDLRVVSGESFGAAAHYFTGSKAHNIRVRSIAADKGLKLNEYGVYKDEERIAGRSEEELFEVLGLPYIPPELREDRGEIEAALEGKIPALIGSEDIRGDLHMHSDWSDGHASIAEMAAAARRRRYGYIAICDHSPHLGVTHGLDAGRLRRQAKEIDDVNARLKDLTVLKGIEVDILDDGRLDLPDEALAELDIVVASVHSRFRQPREVMTQRIIKAVEHPLVHIIGHPTGRLIGRREPYDVDLDAVLSACKAHGKFLELNAHPERLDLSDRHCRQAKAAGVRIVIDSDAHRESDLDLLRFGVATARRGWIEASDVVNTLGLEDLLRALKRRKESN
ncbi:MAG: DNA polymerase/3'-5' exonuclease PolX [Desulfobacterales bacterium]